MTLMTVFVTLVLAAGSAPPGKAVPITTITANDGAELRFVATESQIAAVPAWHPEDGQAAPLDLRLAINLGRDSVRKRNPEIVEFALRSITMSRLDPPYDDRWYYFIQFRPIVGGRPMVGGLYFGCVLANGTVVEPEPEKRTRPAE
jgi:hypothetical protein